MLRNQTRKVARKAQRDAEKHSSRNEQYVRPPGHAAVLQDVIRQYRSSSGISLGTADTVYLPTPADRQIVRRSASSGSPGIIVLDVADAEAQEDSWRRYESSIFRDLCTPTGTQAIMSFFQRWSKPPIFDNSHEMMYLDVLPSLFAQASVSSSFHESVMAIAYRLYAIHHRSEDLNDQALLHYGRALKRLGEAIADPEEFRKDETLATVLILMFCEACIAHRRFSLNISSSRRCKGFSKQRAVWNLLQAHDRCGFSSSPSWPRKLQQH